MNRLLIFAFTLSLLGCADQIARSPTAPTASSDVQPSRPVIPSGNGNAPLAVLKAAFTATPMPPSPGHYSYDLKLLVTETTGKYSATVQAIVVKTPNGDTDMGCVPLGVRVAAGATVDVMQEAGYCAPGANGYYPGLQLSTAITYFDDAGGSATLTALTPQQ